MTPLLFALIMTVHTSPVLPDSSNPVPPVANVIPQTDTLHGDVRVDPYHWLREKTNPEVTSYLEAENAYTAVMMKPTEQLQETLYDEFLSRIQQTDLSVPVRMGEYWYYTRTEEGKQYSVRCRKKGTMEGPEEVLLDLNELAKGKKFLGLGVFNVSDDGNLLAYSLDTTGFRQYRLHVKNLKTGKALPDTFGQVSGAAWLADNKTLYYTKEDHAKRPYRLYRHVLGRKKDDLLYEEKDELYRIWVSRSHDKKYVALTSASSITTEVRYVASNKPNDPLTLLLPREAGHEYYADHRDGLFYIRTNKGAKNFRVVTAPAKSPGLEHWTELVPHRPTVKLEGFELFKDHIVYSEREQGLVRINVVDVRKNTSQTIAFPEPVYAAFPSGNPEYATSKFRYSYQSFITPSSVFEYDMETGATELLKQTEVLGGYDPTLYQSERLWAKATDGALIPLSVVYKKGMRRDGSNPTLLYGYGSYGASMSATFSIPRLSLLDRGVVFAIAHIRGGGEMGEQWYEDGKLLKKKNTFTDFIASAEYLIKEKVTSPSRLVIEGRSAGGLLMGAVLNMRPDLFKAAHVGVPFVDVINTMLDESLPLTVGEFLEWGNPRDRTAYDYIKTYCPYTNITAQAYPDILVTTSLNDSQVMYWEPAKYTARMRATNKNGNLLVLRCNMGAGHGGASGRYDALKETSFVYAFFLHRLGIDR